MRNNEPVIKNSSCVERTRRRVTREGQQTGDREAGQVGRRRLVDGSESRCFQISTCQNRPDGMGSVELATGGPSSCDRNPDLAMAEESSVVKLSPLGEQWKF